MHRPAMNGAGFSYIVVVHRGARQLSPPNPCHAQLCAGELNFEGMP
jgi:hypothetical protein